MPTERTQFARALRSNSTDAERALWQKLPAQQLGARFRRQVPFGPYVLDFYCFDLRLAIELDGGQHHESLKDLVRDDFLAAKGITVLRFWNHDVFQNIEAVLLRLDVVLKKLLTLALPNKRGGNEESGL